MGYLKGVKNAYAHRSDAARYDKARALPAETKTQLMTELKGSIGTPVARIIDLGCGTGRFTGVLAEAFGCPVTGVEPSEAMLEVARQTHAGRETITLLQGRADAIPLERESTSLVFMSQVYHHLPDVSAALRDISRVLEPGGFLAVRNATKETNASASLAWGQFFPEAVATEDARTPTHRELLETVSAAGFSCVRATVLEQLFAHSPSEYAEKIGQRGLSALVTLEDEAFDEGMANLKAWAAEQPDEPVYEALELVFFQKSATQSVP